MNNENQLILDNSALITKLVKSFKPKTYDEYDEYMQLGRIGLLKAIRKHNPDKGKLTTIAWNSIRWEILRHITNNKMKSKIRFKSLEDIDKPSEIHYNIDISESYHYLNSEEKNVLEKRLEGHSFKEIGELNGYSKGWANAIFQKVVEKINKYEEKNSVCR